MSKDKLNNVLVNGMSVKLSDRDIVGSFLDDLKSYLQGRVLTIVDGCITDQEQRKAVKDLVREAIWTQEGYTKSILNVLEGKPPYEDNIEVK